ncbi:MAG: regulatory protein RecX [Candidatus Nanopelagicales bacterium]|nr:regulatory protein RecX [Candidatus Nanopelagicales bacterium]
MARRSTPAASEPTPGSLADLQAEADPTSVARTVVLRRLNSAPRTRKDLYDDLIRREIPPAVADAVLDRFTEVGLIDDAGYAQLFVASRQRSRGTARPVLRQELRRKGVPDDDIADALDAITDEQEHEQARALVRAKLPALARYDEATRQRRLMGLLMRRGYRGGVAAAAIREVAALDLDVDPE